MSYPLTSKSGERRHPVLSACFDLLISLGPRQDTRIGWYAFAVDTRRDVGRRDTWKRSTHFFPSFRIRCSATSTNCPPTYLSLSRSDSHPMDPAAFTFADPHPPMGSVRSEARRNPFRALRPLQEGKARDRNFSQGESETERHPHLMHPRRGASSKGSEQRGNRRLV